MKTPGSPFVPYGQPSQYASKVAQDIRKRAGTTGTGTSRTPLHLLDGMITPNGLHFERHHNGIPDIDPDQHRLFIHGLVKRPLVFTLDALMRYPMESRDRLYRMRRQQRGCCIAKEPAQLGVQRDPRPAVVRRMDRRQARDTAGRGRRGPEARNGCSPKAPTPPA